MAELKPETKAKLDMLTPDKVAAEIEKGSASNYQGDEMDYLFDLKNKYVARADVFATQRNAKRNWAIKIGVLIALLAILTAIIIGVYF